MMYVENLRKFFLDNCSSEDYYSRWYLDIQNCYAKREGWEDIDKDDFVVTGESHAITEYKNMLYPNSNFDGMDFILLNYYLREKGYVIKEFPNQLRQPNINFSDEIRNYIISSGIIDYAKEGKVTWKIRRQITSELIFEKVDSIFIEEELDELFKKISTRDNSFNEMKLDEKLEGICNCLMRLIQKYGFPTYTPKVEEFISPRKIKKLKGELQCFRHADESKVEDYLEKRKEFSNKDKETLVEVGILYVRQYKDFMK